MLVCAPTGAGKTVVGEFAVHLALAAGRKCFYTTPIKALSNQKHNDLVRRYGPERIGLLTGDQSINGDAAGGGDDHRSAAQHAVREFACAARTFARRHGRGALPGRPDARRGVGGGDPAPARRRAAGQPVGDGEQRRGVRRLDPDRARRHHRRRRRAPAGAAVAARDGRQAAVRPVRLPRLRPGEAGRELLVDPELLRHIAHRREADRLADWQPRGRGRHRGRPSMYRPPSRPDVISVLDREGLLPAITFIFSRAGCDAAVKQCLRSSLRLTTDEERRPHRRGRRPPHRRPRRRRPGRARLPRVARGAAARPGRPPRRACCRSSATPSRSCSPPAWSRPYSPRRHWRLGINMPARTVVLERLVKFNGEQHMPLTPGEYTQLTGRAGRRGIDVEGHAVVLWTPDVDPAEVAGLASTRTFPLRSSFAPSYNMTINLVNQMGPDAGAPAAGAVVRAVPGRPLGGRVWCAASSVASRCSTRSPPNVGGRDAPILDYVAAARCRSPNGSAPSRGRRGCSDGRPPTMRWPRCAAATSSPSPTGGAAGLAVVLEPARDERRPAAAGADRTPLGGTDFVGRLLGRVGDAGLDDAAETGRAPPARGCAATWRRRCGRRPPGWTFPGKGQRSGPPPSATSTPNWPACASRLRAHPAHRLPDREDKVRLAERYLRIERDNDQIRQKVAAATNSLARTFDRIVVLLTERGFIRRVNDGDPKVSPTTAGCWPASTARATCWSPSACAAASGRDWTPRSWRRCCRRCSTSPGGDAPGAPTAPTCRPAGCVAR